MEAGVDAGMDADMDAGMDVGMEAGVEADMETDMEAWVCLGLMSDFLAFVSVYIPTIKIACKPLMSDFLALGVSWVCLGVL